MGLLGKFVSGIENSVNVFKSRGWEVESSTCAALGSCWLPTRDAHRETFRGQMYRDVVRVEGVLGCASRNDWSDLQTHAAMLLCYEVQELWVELSCAPGRGKNKHGRHKLSCSWSWSWSLNFVSRFSSALFERIESLRRSLSWWASVIISLQVYF